MKKIKLIKKGDRLFVHPSKLIPNKLNAKIYNTEQDRETVEKLAKDFKRKIELGECPNEQPVMIQTFIVK
jgi:hypothetical protein